MKGKLMRFCAFAFMIVALGLCFVGCGVNKSNKNVEAISIIGNVKTEYYQNEQLELKDIKLKVVYDDDSTTEVDILESMVSGFSTAELGNFVMTITYKEKSITKNYSVVTNPYGNYLLDKNTKIKIYNTSDSTENEYDVATVGIDLGIVISKTNITETFYPANGDGSSIIVKFNYVFDGFRFMSTGIIKTSSTSSNEEIEFNTADGYYANICVRGNKIEFTENFSSDGKLIMTYTLIKNA